MKKKIVFILLALSLILIVPSVRVADSGFDSSYGGGSHSSGGSSHSYGGSSSSGSSSHYYSHSDYSDYDAEDSEFGAIFAIVIVTFLIIIVVCESLAEKKVKRLTSMPAPEYNKKILEKIKETYPNTTEDSIINDALNSYIQFAKCMNERDLDKLKTITNEPLYNRMVETLEKNYDNNCYSISENIKLKKGFIAFLDYFDNVMTATVVLNVEETQYFVNDDKEYIRGNRNEVETIPYQITIKKTLGANNIIITNKVLCTNSAFILNDYDQRNFGSSLNMDELLKIDPELNEDNIIKETYKIYEELQYSWSNFDYDKMRTLVSDELYNNYRLQLRTLSSKKQRNVMEDISFVRGSVKSYEITDTSLNIKVELVVTQNDYITDENDHIIKGDRVKDHNTYELLITRAVSSKVRNNICPNCGAELTGDASQTCTHCGSPLITLSKDFVIAKKKILYQR